MPHIDNAETGQSSSELRKAIISMVLKKKKQKQKQNKKNVSWSPTRWQLLSCF